MSKFKQWDASALLNNDTYLFYFYRLMELAINRFEWKNLPESIDERFLEYTLFCNGMGVFFYDEVVGALFLQVMIGGNLDVYRIPVRRRAYAVNGYNKELTPRDSVIVFNNFLRHPGVWDIMQFTNRLYELERTIDVNVKAQKTPVLLTCEESQRLTLENLYMKYDGNQPFIFGNKNLALNELNVLSTQAPYVVDKLQIQKMYIWNEALNYLGIETANTSKRERLITDEVSAAMGQVEAQRYTALNARRQGARKINELFGLDIEVNFRSEMSTIFTPEFITPYEERQDNVREEEEE